MNDINFDSSMENTEKNSEKQFCANCGKEVVKGMPFCSNCGYKIGSVAEPITEELKKGSAYDFKRLLKKPLIIKVAGLIAVIVVIVLIARFFSGPKATNISLNKKNVSIRVGESIVLTYTIAPTDVKNKDVKWVNTNDSVAKIKDGTLVGVNEGECTITVSTKNGISDMCVVTVLPAKPNLVELYNRFCSSKYADFASDGSFLSIDTNPKDWDDYFDSEAYEAIVNVNKELGIPESVLNRMDSTRALDGVQSWSNDDLEITWSYHPDKGLVVNYSLK